MQRRLSYAPRYALNSICPYFTMFPLEFPLGQLRRSNREFVVFDPFCGRGTTLFAARTCGMTAFGVDASPVAVAVARAKLARVNKGKVLSLARKLIAENPDPAVPTSRFWQRAYRLSVLHDICSLREGLLTRRAGEHASILRAVLLGALHGPLAKDVSKSSYLSNQMPRTFAAKPAYAVKYWASNRLSAPKVEVLDILSRRLDRLVSFAWPAVGRPVHVHIGDSRKATSLVHVPDNIGFVITSPPYYGMRTYVQDQWLRNWFLGGEPAVPYNHGDRFDHSSPDNFSTALSEVWERIAEKAHPDIRLVIRFGSIGSRDVDAEEILRQSLRQSRTGWRVTRSLGVGSAHEGKRQADQMIDAGQAAEEKDFFVRLA